MAGVVEMSSRVGLPARSVGSHRQLGSSSVHGRAQPSCGRAGYGDLGTLQLFLFPARRLATHVKCSQCIKSLRATDAEQPSTDGSGLGAALSSVRELGLAQSRNDRAPSRCLAGLASRDPSDRCGRVLGRRHHRSSSPPVLAHRGHSAQGVLRRVVRDPRRLCPNQHYRRLSPEAHRTVECPGVALSLAAARTHRVAPKAVS